MMMNYHKYPPHPVYHPHPPLLGTSHDPRIGAPPPRPYGAAPPPPARSYLEPYSRAEMDMPRPSPVYHYPHSSSMPSPTSYAAQTVYAPFRPESSGYHVSQTGRGTKRHSMEADTRQPNNHQSYNPSPNHNLHNGLERRMVYREGPQDQSSQSVGSRRMPPPSPPQHYPSRGQSGSASSLSNPFMSREPPSNPAHHRPGSSMSISSMLGSDADRPARDVGSSSSIFSRLPASSAPFGSAPPPSAPSAMSPPSAPARPSPFEYAPFRRSQTPEKPFSKTQSGRPYRSSSGGLSQTSAPEQTKFGGLSRVPPPASQFPEKPHSTHPSPQISSADPSYGETRRLSFSAPAPRPNSQPQHLDPPARPAGYSPLARSSAVPGDSSYSAVHQRSSSYVGHDQPPGRYGGLYGDRHLEEQAHRDRERAMAQEADSKGAPPPSARYNAPYGERDPAATRQQGLSAWDLGRSQPPSPESKRFSAAETGSGFGFGAIQNYTKSLGSQMGGPRPPPLSVQSRSSQPTPPPHEQHQQHQSQQPQQQPYLSKLHTEHRLFPPAPSAGPASLIHSASSDDQRRKGSDELLQHRSLLGVGLDAKRGGRASPLPQAVQGAQAQILGPAGEAGIKSELGRVFSGIGSGVGGVTATTSGSGPSTPMAASPFKRDSLTGRSVNSEATTDDAKAARPPSANGKRSRRSRDEDSRMDSEGGSDLRAGPGRGRRNRHLHHHHHHHHHHRHKPEEEAAAAALGAAHRPFSSMTFPHRTSTPGDSIPPPGPPLGHHHHHHHHHHHASRTSASAATATALTPMREPRTMVNIEPVLASVAHLPRHHLGSTLYATRIGTPTDKATLESAKFGYTTTPLPLPRFEGKENCTFTVRVPRYRIDASHREEICARRALWGTGVYTDDSDPVAAAIHSGFFRGAWGDDVDVDMLDLEIRDAYQHTPKTAQDAGLPEGDRPRIPPLPPPEKDLHITLLVLPRLERYDSSVLFGIRSRTWEGSHDGMSFKVLRVEWVDEGVGRGEERGGAARRKRLRGLMQSGRICTGPGVIKIEQLRNGQIPGRKQAMESTEQQPSPVQPVS